MAELVGGLGGQGVLTTDEVTIRDVRSFIADATYPNSAEGLLNLATQNGANQYIRAAMGEMSSGIYQSENDVILEMTRLGYV
jgi:hypothetical protein